MHTYLEKIAQALHLPEKQTKLIIQEVETHLQQEIQLLMLAGASQQQSEQHAIAEFGEPKAVAQRFNKVHRQWFNSVPRIVLGIAVVLLLRYVVQISFIQIVREQYFFTFTLAKILDMTETALYCILPVMIFQRLKTVTNDVPALYIKLMKITIISTVINSGGAFMLFVYFSLQNGFPVTSLIYTGVIHVVLGYGLAIGIIFGIIFSGLLLYQHFTQQIVAE